METSSRRFIAAAIVVTLFALVVIQPNPAGAQQSPGMDHPIVKAGLAKLGGHGGQCKIFARDVVAAATGRVIGPGYRQAYLNAGGVEVSPANAQAGDVLQISNPANHNAYYPGMHTAIVIENLGGGKYKVIDSNWGWDERVRIHDWTPRPASHLRLYAYRFPAGNASSPPASSPAANPGPAPDLSTGDKAIIATGTSCLNLRSNAGLSHSIIDCMASGGVLTVLSEPTTANGYTWVKVRTESGTEGYVAAEWLVKAPAEAEEVPDAPDLAQGGNGTVDTDGSCLYLREGTGLLKAVLDCLSDGTTVRILSAPTQADGYTWVQVELSNGVRGWVASEYLVPN